MGYYAVYKEKSGKNNLNSIPTDDCLKCHKSCKDCYGPSENECRSCADGLYFYTSPLTKE